MVREELFEKSLVELRVLAKQYGLKSITALRKPELVERLMRYHQGEPTATPPAKRGRPPKATESETPAAKPTPAAEAQSAPRPSYNKRNDQTAPAYRPYRENAQRPYTPRDHSGSAQPRNGQPPRQRHGNYEDRERNYENMLSLSDILASGNCFDCKGILEIVDSYGFLRTENYYAGPKDIYVAPAQIYRFRMKTGDLVEGKGYFKNANDKYPALVQIDQINGDTPVDNERRVVFEELVPIFPEERYTLEAGGRNNVLSTRLIDLISPIGKGQRAMIVSQPKAGKTTLLKQIANGIAENNPNVHLIVLLIDERPEEVTDMKRSVRGEVVYSTFDELPEHHTRIAEMVQERAMRLVEKGKDVVILMDSLTRLARAYNLVIPPTGRTLSGGMDPGALHKPKRFFGAARNIENGGSLTVIATALVETGSRMDDIVYEEFKGTGNMEIHLDRKLAERRVFPAIDIYKSGTRRDDLLLSKAELEGVRMIRRVLAGGAPTEVTEQLITMIDKTATNEEFLIKLRDWVRIFEKEGYTSSGAQNRYGQ
ncbi:MAG: transcription termination factor Rho [Clostridiales bacterium]|nr:transcription termination factor Rho [Clostridiales bacterium]